MLLKATWETIYIVFISSFISVIAGAALGIVLFLTKDKNIWLNRSLSLVVNATRSIPFIILMISIIPLTRLIVGTSIGINAAIVPLTLAAIPFFARISENAFSEIPHGLIETAHSLGATTQQLITKILIPESLPTLIRGITLTIIALIGYSAMAGVVGGGGLGELAINYGYQRFDAVVTLETVLILIVIVQLVQLSGDVLAKKRQIKPLIFASIALAMACFSFQAWPYLFPEAKSLRVGVLMGWPEDVMKVAQKEALAHYGLHLKILTFNDYVLPNTALANGNIDANIFQHEPYLQAQLKARHYPLISIAKTFVYPMGFYSKNLKQLSDLKSGAMVALPNDPSNEARALLLLEKTHLIALKNKGALTSIKDIVSNPKQFHFKLLDAAELPRVLKDADLVALTNDYVGAVGLSIEQALLKEGSDSLYANIIVVREQDKDNPLFQELIAIMHSKAVKDATQKIFPKGAAIVSWS